MPVWASLLLGLLGALVGAGGAVASQWHSANRQDRRVERERQLQGAVNLLNAAYGFLASADELQEVLVSQATADRVELVHSRYMRRWEAYVDQLGLARLTSPIGVTRAARRLEESLYDLVGTCDRWNSAYLRGDDTEVHAERWERAFIDAADRRRDYVRAARMEFVEYGPGPAEDDEARQAV